ncbi:MAG: hypothetical protein AAGD11_12025 [Planctomycetota bacterium]
MVNLTKASRELFQRTPDERFQSFDALLAHCHERREQSTESWQFSQDLRIEELNGELQLRLENAEDAQLSLSDWSFTQLYKLCGVHKDNPGSQRGSHNYWNYIGGRSLKYTETEAA